MRIYASPYELMSETARNLWEMGQEVKPKTYQNKVIEGNPDYITKEIICQQNCLTSISGGIAPLFAFDKESEAWANAELIERVNEKDHPINPGVAYILRKKVWDEFMVDKKMDYTYNERIWYGIQHFDYGNLRKIINELRRNPGTRQAVLPIYSLNDVSNIGGKKRVPCSMYYNFLVREDVNGNPQVNICYHQRSSDFVTHFGNDVYLAWMLMEYVASEIGVKPGYLYHTIDSLHSYKKDWDKLKTPISEFLQTPQ